MLLLVLWWVPGLTAALDIDPTWQTYSNSSLGFAIQYPPITHPETLREKTLGLVAQMAFGFEQPFQKGEDTGSLKFRFQVLAWRNTNHLTPEAWAKEHTHPKLTSAIRPTRVANRQGVALQTSNLAWSTQKVFVADKDLMYELNYTDVASNEILSKDKRSHWASVFSGMIESFMLLSPDDKSK
jgi:hypothetical protein